MENLKYEIYIGGTPEQVWNVLVSPQETPKIYFGSRLESTFEVGAPMRYAGPGVDGDDTVHIYGTVLEFAPQQAFRHTHKVGESYGAEHANFESRISYLLEPQGALTKLTVLHDDFAEGDPSYSGSVSGWAMLLSAIKTLVETGKPLDLGSHNG